MRRILISGHACSPGMGSEPGVTWNWAWHLSALHDVWVLTHPQYRDRVDGYLAEHPNPRLHIEYVSLPPLRDPWKPEQGEQGLGLHYVLWQRQALRAARELHERLRFDVAHHVSWTTVSTAPLLWKLPIPFVWGPVGGGITAPMPFLCYFAGAWPKEVLRTVRIRLTPLAPGFRNAVKHTAALFASNRETVQFLKRAGARDVRFLLDVGLTAQEAQLQVMPRRPQKTVRLLWAGRLEPRKALPIVLEALATLGSELPFQLTVAGDGPLRGEWQARAEQLGLSGRVDFLGRVPSEKMPSLFKQSDAFVFTSLRDGFGSVVLEALAHGLPVVALDHQGVGSVIPGSAAIKVPVSNRSETIRAFANGLRRLSSAEERIRLSGAARAFAESQHWSQRAAIMSDCYEECIRRTSVEYSKICL